MFSLDSPLKSFFGLCFDSKWGENDNRYFRRFWRNAVRWLSENSNAGNKRLQIETDRVIYRVGQPIQITARAFDDQNRETIDYQLTAQVKSATRKNTALIAAATPLISTPQGTAYSGTLETQSLDLAAGSAVLSSVEVDVIATHNEKEVLRATTRVMVLPDLHELVQPRAQSEVLEQLSAATGGKTLRGSADLTALLRDMPATPGDSIISRQPLWDNPWIWLLIVALLTIEWSMRRLSGYG